MGKQGGTAGKIKHFRWYAAALVLAGLALRAGLAARYGGFISDQRLFVQWGAAVADRGLAGAYLAIGSLNYPPLFPLLLGAYEALARAFGWSPAAGELSFKALLLAIDLAALIAVAWWARRRGETLAGLGALALVALNPALIADGAVWGQVDLLHGMLMAAAVILVADRPGASGLCFALALLTKFQAVTVLPVLAAYLLVQAVRFRRIQMCATWLCGFGLPLLAAFAYFKARGALGAMFAQAYGDAVGSFTGVTVNAMNIWSGILGIGPDARDTGLLFGVLSYRALGLGLFAAAALLVCAYVALATARLGPELPGIAQPDPAQSDRAQAGPDERPANQHRLRQATQAMLLRASAVVSFAFFMLPTEIHERYGVPALILAALAVLYDLRWAIGAAALTATTLVNLLVVLRHGGGAPGAPWMSGGGGGGTMRRQPGQRGGGGRGGAAADIGGGSPRGQGGGFGGGEPTNLLTAGHQWIAALNLLLLLGMCWLLWQEVRGGLRRSAPAAEGSQDV